MVIERKVADRAQHRRYGYLFVIHRAAVGKNNVYRDAEDDAMKRGSDETRQPLLTDLPFFGFNFYS
jgi:hypothetical protein